MLSTPASSLHYPYIRAIIHRKNIASVRLPRSRNAVLEITSRFYITTSYSMLTQLYKNVPGEIRHFFSGTQRDKVGPAGRETLSQRLTVLEIATSFTTQLKWACTRSSSDYAVYKGSAVYTCTWNLVCQSCWYFWSYHCEVFFFRHNFKSNCLFFNIFHTVFFIQHLIVLWFNLEDEELYIPPRSLLYSYFGERP